jgi:hypothetical protein
MKRSVIYTFIALLFLTSFSAPKPKKVKWLEGKWRGIGYEDDFKEIWEVVLDFNNRDGLMKISYPSFPCGGDWELVSSNKHKATFIEHITKNPNLCQDEGTVVVTKIDSKFVSVAFFLPDYSDDVTAFTVLKKLD